MLIVSEMQKENPERHKSLNPNYKLVTNFTSYKEVKKDWKKSTSPCWMLIVSETQKENPERHKSLNPNYKLVTQDLHIPSY